MSYSNRASVIAVGVGNYKYMPRLSGPSKDIEKIKNLKPRLRLDIWQRTKLFEELFVSGLITFYSQ